MNPYPLEGEQYVMTLIGLVHRDCFEAEQAFFHALEVAEDGACVPCPKGIALSHPLRSPQPPPAASEQGKGTVTPPWAEPLRRDPTASDEVEDMTWEEVHRRKWGGPPFETPLK